MKTKIGKTNGGNYVAIDENGRKVCLLTGSMSFVEGRTPDFPADICTAVIEAESAEAACRAWAKKDAEEAAVREARLAEERAANNAVALNNIIRDLVATGQTVARLHRLAEKNRKAAARAEAKAKRAKARADERLVKIARRVARKAPEAPVKGLGFVREEIPEDRFNMIEYAAGAHAALVSERTSGAYGKISYPKRCYASPELAAALAKAAYIAKKDNKPK